jgi:16S rRNA (guanine527-N7)-methyltransferase
VADGVREAISDIFVVAGFADVDPRARERLERYVALVAKWNRAIKLFAFANPRELVERHLVDGLAAAHKVGPRDRVLDVGAGGGVPSVVVAALRPEAAVVALEPVHKKHAFLMTARRELGLEGYEPRAERLEQYAGLDFDVAMSRATFGLSEWLALGLERVRPGGLVLGFEGRETVDLPPGATREPYAVVERTRALICQRRR